MLVEERTYVLNPVYSPQDYLREYREHGEKLQTEILGGLLGYFTVEIGQLNAIISLWEYQSFEDRQARRARLAAEPGWHEYLAKVRPMIAQMNNRLMLRAI